MESVKPYPGFEPFSPEEKKRRLEHHTKNSSFLALLGIRVVDLEPGYARQELPFRKEITHGGGVVQGGIITTLADSCIANATIAALDAEHSNSATIELKINFIRPARGGTFIAEARLLHLGRRTAVGEAEVRTESGKLVAKCLSSLMVINDREKGDPKRDGGENDNEEGDTLSLG